MKQEVPFVVVYADESCLGNGREGSNPGGAAGLVEYARRSGQLVRRDYWISEPATTNNRMALRSVIEAFNGLVAKGRTTFDVLFVSDSQYLINGMTDWVHGWARRGWRRAGGPIENLELWWAAIRAVRTSRVAWRWVRGHDGHPQNSYADHLATTAARQQGRSDGLVPSRFDTWVRTGMDTGQLVVPPHPFPSPTTFRPDSPLPPTPEANRTIFA